MKTAAIYCRKSTPQPGVEDADRSVARQEENARKFCAARGWTVVETFADDEVGGAETTKLRGKQRMLDAIRSGRATFDVLVAQSADRMSRRDGDEAFGELKAIARAGIEIWFYADGARFDFGTFETNVMGYLRAEVNAEFRRGIAKKTREALARKAERGHVVGGRVFGYDNVRVNGHTERRVNDAEAAAVRRIYELYAGGQGLPTIAKTLTAEGAPCPRVRGANAAPNGWRGSSVREILKRPTYRGQIVYGKARKRDKEGHVRPSRQPESAWLRVEAPELRIVPPELADAVDARFASMGTRALRTANGRLIGRPPGEGSPYLLVGLLSCGTCGGSMEVLSSASGTRRLFSYRCSVARRKGPAFCANTTAAPMGDADAAVLAAIEETLLDRAVVDRAIAYAEAALLAPTPEATNALAIDLAKTERAIERITGAIAMGTEDLGSLVAALATQEARRTDLRARLEATPTPAPSFDRLAVRRALLGYVEDWRGLLRGHVGQAQQILRRLVVGRLTFAPKRVGREVFYEFSGKGTVRPLLAGTIRNVASPTGFEPVF